MPYSQWTLLLAPAAGSAEASSRVSKLSAWGAVDALTAALAHSIELEQIRVFREMLRLWYAYVKIKSLG